MSFIIFDTEYTSWKGCQEYGWQGSQKKEIVQIAALKVIDNLEVCAQFNALCKPVINSVSSRYFTDLTHITNQQIAEKGEKFSVAYEKFKKFAAGNICYSHGWGAEYWDISDGQIINENIALYNLPTDNSIKYRNIAAIFAKLYKQNHILIKSQSSGQIAELLGIEKNLQNLGIKKHNALYDVYSILEGLKYFYPRSISLLKDMEK